MTQGWIPIEKNLCQPLEIHTSGATKSVIKIFDLLRHSVFQTELGWDLSGHIPEFQKEDQLSEFVIARPQGANSLVGGLRATRIDKIMPRAQLISEDLKRFFLSYRPYNQIYTINGLAIIPEFRKKLGKTSPGSDALTLGEALVETLIQWTRNNQGELILASVNFPHLAKLFLGRGFFFVSNPIVYGPPENQVVNMAYMHKCRPLPQINSIRENHDLVSSSLYPSKEYPFDDRPGIRDIIS